MEYNYDNIVISGEPLSGKSALVNGLLKKLEGNGWRYHSIGDLVKAEYAEYKNSLQEKEKALTLAEWWGGLPDNRQIAFNEDLFGMVRKGKMITDTRYATICKDGNLLYRVTGNETYKGVKLRSLLVFMEAPLDIKVARAMDRKDYEGKTEREVRDDLLIREGKEIVLGYHLFGIPYQERGSYDLILNSAKMTPDEEVSEVMKLMKK